MCIKIKSLFIKWISVICRFIPKNRRIWVFGSRDGQYYNENSKALFEYVNCAAPQIHAIWLTRNYHIYEKLKGKGYKVYKSNSLFGWVYSLMAGAVFVNVSLSDVNKLAVSGAFATQLCHGTPLKMIDINCFGPNEKYDMIIVAAEEFLHNNVYPEFEGNSGFSGIGRKGRLVLTGYPRTDVLLSFEKIESVELLKAKHKCDRMILYLPTHRDKFKSDTLIEDFVFLGSFGLDLDCLENLMERYNALFVFKLHPAQRFRNDTMVEQIRKSNHLHIIDSADPLEDVYAYLGYADILITDYSSVYFDFLLLNRPVIFAPFDFNDFVAKRALVFSYNEVTPGPKAKNWDEVCYWLQEILGGRDDWTESRQIINQRFNAFHDGRSSERVYKESISLLGLDPVRNQKKYM